MIDSSGAAGRFKPLQQTRPDAEKVEKQFKEVAQLYEKHFMREMMKAMRSTVPDSNFIKQNQGEKIFREQLDQEYVEKWGDHGGIGLSDMIYNQLIEKYGFTEFSLENLYINSLISRTDKVKLLATGELKAKLTFKVNAASDKAKAAVEAAGGTLEIIK